MSKHISEESKGPRKGHAAGDTSIEQQASQLASDIKYKARQKMKAKSGSNLSPGQVQALYRSLLSSSPAPGGVKALVKKKLFGEQVDRGEMLVNEIVEDTRSSVFGRVFGKEEIEEAADQKFVIRVTDKATGNTSYRKADRAKIAELRANKNISSVEITGRKKADDAYGEKHEKKYGPAKGKNTVGDRDGDGTKEPDRHEYAGVKDRAIKKAMAKEEVIYEKEEGGEKKLDVMKGKNKVKVNPTIGESIRAELDALKAQRVEEAAAAAAKEGPSPEERQQLMNKDKMLKRKIMMQKQTMQMQRQGRLPLNYSESCDTCEKCDKSPCECPKKEGEAKAMDPREVPTRINLAKNKLRAMGLKMSYDMEGEVVEEGLGKRMAAAGAAGAIALGAGGMMGKKVEKDVKQVRSGGVTRVNTLADKVSKRNAMLKKISQMQSFKPEGEMTEARKPEVEAQGKKIAGYEREGRAAALVSRFRKENPGSRQAKKVPGAKETEGDAANRRRGAQAKRAAKHGLTSKERKESQARAKYDSPRD